MLNSSMAFIIVGVFALLVGSAFVFLIVTSGINSRCEEEYWSNYCMDTPTTDKIALRVDSADGQKSEENSGLEKAA